MRTSERLELWRKWRILYLCGDLPCVNSLACNPFKCLFIIFVSLEMFGASRSNTLMQYITDQRNVSGTTRSVSAVPIKHRHKRTRAEK